MLLHGWPQHFYAWRHVIDRLKGDFRVYAPDLRGFGWSDAPEGQYSKNGLACDVELLLDELGIETCRLAGHDWGGFVAFLTALRAPERIDRLAAFNIIHPWTRSGSRRRACCCAPRTSTSWPRPASGRRSSASADRRCRRCCGAARDPASSSTRARWGSTPGQFTRPAHARAASALYRTFLARELPALARGKYANRSLGVAGVLATSDGDPVVLAGAARGPEPSTRRT